MRIQINENSPTKNNVIFKSVFVFNELIFLFSAVIGFVTCLSKWGQWVSSLFPTFKHWPPSVEHMFLVLGVDTLTHYEVSPCCSVSSIVPQLLVLPSPCQSSLRSRVHF